MSYHVEKDQKRAVDTVARQIDLSWFCARKWRPGMFVEAGTRIRAFPTLLDGTIGTTGYEYEADADGWTGDEEPQWPSSSGGTVVDGSITWSRQEVTVDSLERTVSNANDVVWDGDSGMTVSAPSLDTGSGQVIISALHAGGTAGQRLSTWADVTFSDTTIERFEISWKLT